MAADVKAFGSWMEVEAKRRIGHHYPDATLDDGRKTTTIAWMWARTVNSPDPAWPGHVPLVKSWILSKKPRQPVVWVEPVVDPHSRTITSGVPEGWNSYGRNGRTIRREMHELLDHRSRLATSDLKDKPVDWERNLLR